MLQQSLAALQGNTSLTDVTLSGTARRIAGSDDEFGTGIFKALAVGAARMDLTLSSGQRSEVEGTPTFYVNGIRHDGGYDLESLRSAILASTQRKSEAH